ncbi:DDHD domain-containing protein [Lasiosphaeria miniovina]|uniref:DDHD domain-containing protein n=1 Tax=Lasiosphaeria miniovina TaxID=1954250 RepID=A0AA40DMU0_9PEZI|nr:DDHD domain-containing protein [Lasiosphaeria miniovina]KAK0706627.1 DDHD domain-containing protein [Lasiosphaeria miniovina]
MASANPTHTYGPACRLVPTADQEPVDGLEGIPRVDAQFFYSSPISIDDPLSAVTIATSTDSKSSRAPFRPFSPGDNLTLERAWHGFASDRDRRNHRQAQRNRSPSPSLSKENAEKLSAIVAHLTAKHKEKHDREGQAPRAPLDAPDSSVPVCCPELLIDASAELRNEFCALTRKRQQSLNHERVVEGVMDQLNRLRPDPDIAEAASSAAASGLVFGTSPGQNLIEISASTAANETQLPLPASGLISPRPPMVDDGISGKPFVRVEPSLRSPGIALLDKQSKSLPETNAQVKAESARNKRPRSSTTVTAETADPGSDSVEIAVGVSRLHMVSLPVLQMKPIYWSPVNDISIVLRATWFYRDSMAPVEPAVANQLEAGYRELRAWTETWSDELRSALDVGALGEEKVTHRLWPDVSDKRLKSKCGFAQEPLISCDPFCAARCFRGEAAAEGTLEPVKPDDEASTSPPEHRSYPNYHVIYKDASAAFLLKSSLKPSAYYGRKPVSKIMKDLTVGIPVVRGFDAAKWERMHEKQKAPSVRDYRPTLQATAPGESAEQAGCAACELQKDRGHVTDLILFAHGIGQKFAERVESFHFTHAINSFRREVNVELESPAVKSVLRPEQNGIMVLPVNWRHIVSFEDGGPAEDEGKAPYAPEGFGLKDIEPTTIPAVRSMISDIMFDIPFYMSHLKPKMIAALVGEANRVYRLWCRNNPGFAENGRVHLVAHSLGSAMAIDILSKQPTYVPRLDLAARPAAETRHFEFDTTNLFLLGSPASFFLLLERGGLVPRRGRLKPGADAVDTVAKDVVGDVGMFGCCAVDNIYNILAKEDPIAYLLNGTIDPAYAASLKTAYVPSTATSLLKSVGDAVRGMVGVGPPAAAAAAAAAGDNAAGAAGDKNNSSNPKMPSMPRLPSQLELDVHDFSREEIAERKAFLLNDNGQIDYFLRSGGGPLELQYLNMLSAHSSYWYSRDLVRLLCVEIGRVPGRESTLPAMRAVKAAKLRVAPAAGPRTHI